jgi:hypothetical protein
VTLQTELTFDGGKKTSFRFLNFALFREAAVEFYYAAARILPKTGSAVVAQPHSSLTKKQAAQKLQKDG